VANPIQWGIDQVFAQLNNVVSQAHAERSQIYLNTAHLNDLTAVSTSIADPAARQAMKDWLEKSWTRQREVSNLYRMFADKFANAAAALKQFLIDNGIEPTVPGLGAAPLLVPIVVVGLVLTATAMVIYIHEKNVPQTKAIEFQMQGLSALQSGGASVAQLIDYMNKSEATVAGMKPTSPDPFGLTGFAQALVPVALIVAAAVIVPRLLPSRAAA